jgi:hypothetical protein
LRTGFPFGAWFSRVPFVAFFSLWALRAGRALEWRLVLQGSDAVAELADGADEAVLLLRLTQEVDDIRLRAQCRERGNKEKYDEDTSGD